MSESVFESLSENVSESVCCPQAAAEVVYVPDMQGPESATLMGAVGVRLRAALRSPSPPLVCSAARTAGWFVI